MITKIGNKNYKRCSCCNELMAVSYFYKRGEGDGYHNQCKMCILDKQREHNKDSAVKKKKAKYYKENREQFALTHIRLREKNPERYREYNRKSREKNKDKHRNYYKRWKSRPQNRIRVNLTNRMHSALKKTTGEYKNCSLWYIVGCSKEFLRGYLESQFTAGMSWENYGKWHIDHIRPCASFDLTDESQQKECFHYSNLQPLWAEDNLRKSAKREE